MDGGAVAVNDRLDKVGFFERLRLERTTSYIEAKHPGTAKLTRFNTAGNRSNRLPGDVVVLHRVHSLVIERSEVGNKAEVEALTDIKCRLEKGRRLSRRKSASLKSDTRQLLSRESLSLGSAIPLGSLRDNFGDDVEQRSKSSSKKFGVTFADVSDEEEGSDNCTLKMKSIDALM